MGATAYARTNLPGSADALTSRVMTSSTSTFLGVMPAIIACLNGMLKQAGSESLPMSGRAHYEPLTV